MKNDLVAALEELDKVKKERDKYKSALDKKKVYLDEEMERVYATEDYHIVQTEKDLVASIHRGVEDLVHFKVAKLKHQEQVSDM